MDKPLEKFREIFNRLDKEPVKLIRDLYREDIVFQDPIHEIRGLDNLQKYMEGLYEGVQSCQFDFTDPLAAEGEAWQPWTMRLVHPKLHKKGPAVVAGTSHIQHDGAKVTFHRDYFDMGAMIYEHVPVLGGIVRKVKARL